MVEKPSMSKVVFREKLIQKKVNVLGLSPKNTERAFYVVIEVHAFLPLRVFENSLFIIEWSCCPESFADRGAATYTRRDIGAFHGRNRGTKPKFPKSAENIKVIVKAESPQRQT